MFMRPKQRKFSFAGYTFTSGPEGTVIDRVPVGATESGEIGCDPLGDGTFRMVPSGDIVDYEERCRRLAPRKAVAP